MICERFERTCEIVADTESPAPMHAEIQMHALACAECAELLALTERLREGRGAFAVPEPAPAYWRSFDRRLEARIGHRTAGPVAQMLQPAWRAWRSLALAASMLLVVALLALVSRRSAGPLSILPSRLVAEAPGEADLLDRLGKAEPERLQDALDRLVPGEDAPSLEDLANLVVPLSTPSEQDSGARPSGDSPYDLFLELADEERGRLLKEMRGEIG